MVRPGDVRWEVCAVWGGRPWTSQSFPTEREAARYRDWLLLEAATVSRATVRSFVVPEEEEE